MNIVLTDQELRYLEMLAHGRNDPKIGVVANRRVDERRDDYQINLEGLKAEYAVAKYLGVPLDDEINLRGRRQRGNLRYFDKWLEVKWNNRSTGDLYFNNLLQFGADVAVLVVPGVKGTVRIVGWIKRNEFKTKWQVKRRYDSVTGNLVTKEGKYGEAEALVEVME
jgi:hypothetical protein